MSFTSRNTVPFIAAALLSIGVTTSQAQVNARSGLWVGAPLDEYLRLLQLTGEVPLTSRMLRPLEYEARRLSLSDTAPLHDNPWRARYGSSQRAAGSRYSLEVLEPLLRVTSNSAVPYGTNDGAMWAGKGLSGSLTTGAAMHYGPLTIRLAPVVTYSQNLDFPLGPLTNPLPNTSPYADPYLPSDVDLPQRFGDRPIARLDAGQSSVQLNGLGVRGGISTENMWWGPGIEHSILMSNNAPGFAHVFLGTQRPIDVRIAKLEALYTVGRLEQSGFWIQDRPDSLSRRWMASLGIVLEPSGAPGLFVGATRVFQGYIPAGGIEWGDLVTVFQPLTKNAFVTAENPSGTDDRDQLLSLFARWAFPSSRFEAYGEFARNDHSADMRDVVLEPEHASAYLLGMQKLFEQKGGFLRMSAEVVSLSAGLTQLVRSNGTWYSHNPVRQGYTHRGQVLGSAVGPGGEGQNLGLNWYRSWGSIGGLVQRQRVNTDAYFRRYRTPFNRHRHDVFLGFGLRAVVVRGPAEFTAQFTRQKEYNRYFVLRNDVTNYHLDLGTQIVLR